MPLESFLHSRPQDTPKPQHYKTFPICQSHEILPNTAGPRYPSQQGSTSESSLWQPLTSLPKISHSESSTQQPLKIMFNLAVPQTPQHNSHVESFSTWQHHRCFPMLSPFSSLMNTEAPQNHHEVDPKILLNTEALRIPPNRTTPKILFSTACHLNTSQQSSSWEFSISQSFRILPQTAGIQIILRRRI